jgi:hypothetical protein
MASVTYGKYVYGLNDLAVTNIGGTTQEDLDAAQTMEVEPQFKVGEFEGDDALKAVVSFITHATGTISAGSISSAALEIMTGISLATSGSTPNEETELQVDEATRMPYFKIYGKALDESTGDIHLLVHKAKITGGLKLTAGNGEIMMSEAEFIAVDDGTNGVFELIQNETAAAVPAS